jgi:large subunit ribosomal protein L30
MVRLLALIRIKGTVKVPKRVRETLDRLRLTKRNSMAIYYHTPSIEGMIKRVDRYLAWGEIDTNLLAALLEKRGRVRNGRKIDYRCLQRFGCQSITELAEGIEKGNLNDYVKKGLLRVFRLTPPSKGFPADLRKPFRIGGVWGYQGDRVCDLIEKMM